jgi:hypothetical protein
MAWLCHDGVAPRRTPGRPLARSPVTDPGTTGLDGVDRDRSSDDAETTSADRPDTSEVVGGQRPVDARTTIQR